MTREQFYNAVADPDGITPDDVDALARTVRRFPYFHAGWMLLAKGLSVTGSAHFSSELKKASIHVWDRGALFWLVNGRDDVRPPAPHATEESLPAAQECENRTTPQPEVAETATRDAVPHAPQKVITPVEPVEADFFAAEDDTAMAPEAQGGYSLHDYDDHLRRPDERYTFADWLDYVSERQSIVGREAEQDRHIEQNKLIDAFLSAPVGRITLSVPKPTSQSEAKKIEERSVSENEDILTETLASIYLKQGKLEKAVNIFKRLSLKYPEKSDYFASRIADIQKQIN